MRKAVVGWVTVLVTVLTTSGLAAANALTTDLALTVDGATTQLRIVGDATVAQVLSGQGVQVDASDFVTPELDAKVTDGGHIEVSHTRSFTATIDGKTQTFTTTATTVGGALMEIGVHPSAADISLPPQTSITAGDANVTVATQKFVALQADGATLYTQTAAGTVGDLLTERGVTLGDLDRLAPAADTALSEDLTVVVQRVVVTEQTITAEVPFPVKVVKTMSLPEGEQKVKTPGVNGVATDVWSVTIVDDVEESRDLVSQTMVTEPVAQVVEVGYTPPTRPAPATVDPGSPQDIGRSLLAEFGFGDDQFGCLVDLWNHESHWRVNAQNPSSGAYGIPQALPGSKMGTFGDDWQTNPVTQIRWGLNYIKNRYGSPCGAFEHWQNSGWY